MSLKKFLFATTIIITFFYGGCLRTSKGSIKRAIRVSLKQKVPTSLTGHWLGSKEFENVASDLIKNIASEKLLEAEDADVDEMIIIKSNKITDKEKKTWLVKVYARGTCKNIFNKEKQFEGVADYKVIKNRHGDWIAEPIESS